MNTTDRLMTTGEIAEILNVKPATIRKWIESGSLDALPVGQQWRIKLSALEAFLGRPLSDYIIGGADAGDDHAEE